jgi:tetratricopeptide (TPR) repeat protein
MPKPRRTPKKAKAKRDENEQNLRELALFLEQSDRFQLGLATCDSYATRQAMLDRLESLVADRPVHLTRLDLGKFPGEELLLDRLQQHLRDHPAPEGKKPAVMVVGLEALLDYREIDPIRPAPQPILRNANIQRDAFPRLVPAAVVLWLLPTAARIFALEAPDLWHWRSGTFRFSGPPDHRQERERAHVGMPSIESFSLPVPEKSERIALLRDLLIEREDDEDRESAGSKARKAHLLLQLGLAYYSVSKSEDALKYFEEAASLFRAIGDRRDEGAALGNLGLTYAALGRLERAIGYYEQHLAIARAIGDRRGEGSALGNLGLAYAALGQAGQAIGYYEQALAIARAIGDRQGESRSLGNLGNAYAALGQAGRAIAYYEQYLAIARAIGDRWGEGNALGSLGNAYLRLGQAERAIGYYEQALAIMRAIGDRQDEGAALGSLGNAYANLGQAGRAIGYYERALEIYRAIGDRRGEGGALGNLGIAYAALGQAEQAADLLRQSLQIGREIKDPRIVRVAEEALRKNSGEEASTKSGVGSETDEAVAVKDGAGSAGGERPKGEGR